MVGIANPVILKNEEKILRWLIFYPEDPMIWSRKMVKKLSEETLLKSVILSQRIKKLEKDGLIEIKEVKKEVYMLVDIIEVIKKYPQFFGSRVKKQK